LIDPNASISDIKDVSDVVANAFTALAIAVGGAWAYWRFIRERTRWPRASIAVEFTERQLAPSNVLLAVKLKVKNEGRGLMKITDLRFDLHCVKPFDEGLAQQLEREECVYGDSGLEGAWPLIGQGTRSWTDGCPELEPEESDEFSCDFFLLDGEQVVFLYAYVENVKKKQGRKKLGWSTTAFYDLSPETPLTGASGRS